MSPIPTFPAVCPAAPAGPCDWIPRGAFDDLSGRVGAVGVEQCGRCGHARSLPPLADVGFLYEGRQSQDYQPDNRGLAHAIKAVAFRRSAAALVRQLGTKPEALLDFGCGSGQFTRELGTVLGPGRVTGADFFDEPPADLADRPYVAMPALAGMAGRFDCVIAMHVLEHDDDPRALLRRMIALLRPGGQLVIEVPNVSCFGARLFGRHWDAWYLPYHRVHFTRTSLLAALAAEGLVAVQVHKAVVPTMGRTLANLFGRANTLPWLLAGIAAHPLQLLGEAVTGEPSAWRVIARRA